MRRENMPMTKRPSLKPIIKLAKPGGIVVNPIPLVTGNQSIP